MSQHPIEVILTRQLAEYLAVPIFLVDQAGDLVYYNEPAERLLGARFEETGEMPAEVWSRAFAPSDEQGERLEPAKLPLVISLERGRPSQRRLWITGLDGVRRHLEIGSFPLIGQGGRRLGAVAMLWEIAE